VPPFENPHDFETHRANKDKHVELAQDGRRNQFAFLLAGAAFSVSESQVPVVKKYIQQQPEHHRGNRWLSFQDELRALLKKSGVAFDERYLCD
jgi:putative transposase